MPSIFSIFTGNVSHINMVLHCVHFLFTVLYNFLDNTRVNTVH